MSKKTILVVEDERDMADLLAMRLTREGYDVDVAYDGREGLSKVQSDTPDLVLLDIMLPKMTGTDVANEIRHDPRTSGVPIIMLTAKGEESDVVVGLQIGADDYVTKPFSMPVLLARVKAILRRASAVAGPREGPLKVGSITIDPDRHQVEVHGKPVQVTLTEFRILTALVAARGRVLSRDQLIDQAMGINTIVTDRTIDVHLTALRRKLGDARKYIQTVRGVGYRLATELSEDDEEE